MLRRIHTAAAVRAGDMALSEREAHHARDVLRLVAGEIVEVFDDAGAVARGTIVSSGAGGVLVHVDEPSSDGATPAVRLTVAAAVPKGDRADWMVEKLSELGVERFVPLAAARSVVLPEGKNKRDRWTRLATEAAKQSRRRGVMRVEELTKVDDALRLARAEGSCWFLSTAAGAAPVLDLLTGDVPASLAAFVGPEGGWTDDEMGRFAAADSTAVKLTPTVLRVETAAIAIASIVGSVQRVP